LGFHTIALAACKKDLRFQLKGNGLSISSEKAHEVSSAGRFEV